MARKTKSKTPLEWVEFKRTIADHEIEGRWAIDGDAVRVITPNGTKIAALLGTSDPERIAMMVAVELKKGM